METAVWLGGGLEDDKGSEVEPDTRSWSCYGTSARIGHSQL